MSTNSNIQKRKNELIIEMMPFSQELIEWCKIHSEFISALKIIYPERFISLSAIVTSYSPNYPKDEVIGIYTYDYGRKSPIFKQDFVVNKGKLNTEFILYSRNYKVGSSKYVKDINDFFTTYGKGGYYINSHHLTLDQLPNEIRQRGLSAISIANKLKGKTIEQPTLAQIEKIHSEVKRIKEKGEFVEWIKLKNT